MKAPPHISVAVDELSIRCEPCGKSLVYVTGTRLQDWKQICTDFIKKHGECKPKDHE